MGQQYVVDGQVSQTERGRLGHHRMGGGNSAYRANGRNRRTQIIERYPSSIRRGGSVRFCSPNASIVCCRSPNLQSSQRIPYISALTALSATDGEGGDWLDLAEFVRAIGADTQELWRRAVFGAAIGNCDDHLRNHGFLRVSTGWRLSPAIRSQPRAVRSTDRRHASTDIIRRFEHQRAFFVRERCARPLRCATG